MALADHPFARNILGSPVHVLVFDRAKRTGAQSIKRHLWTGELPSGAIWDIEGFGQITSPVMTLFLMARELSAVQLAMAMCEFCGGFSVFRPTRETEELLRATRSWEKLDSYAGWVRVKDYSARPTGLWKRPSLVEPDELRAFIKETEGIRGCRTFARAVHMVAGFTRSPFEVQTALLMLLPRRLGGYGLSIETDKEIKLTRSAQRLAPQGRAYSDIYIVSSDGKRAIDFECQGGVIHSGEAASIDDARRTTALESMGIKVVLATYDQVRDAASFEVLMEYVFQELHLRFRKKSAEERERERLLRSELFIDWETLGNAAYR